MADIKNYIECKHPGFLVADIVDDSDVQKNLLRIRLLGNVSDDDKAKIEKTLDEFNQPWNFVVEDSGEMGNWQKREPWPFFVPSASSLGNSNAPYLQRDEALWFDNVKGIYAGSFTKEDLFFFNPSQTSCLVNFSTHRNINIRNHLLLYDVIYCLLPSYSGMREFCNNQQISTEDILEMVQRGRIKVLMMEPETDYDLGFFNEIYGVNGDAVISRRAVGALLASDTVSIYNSYIFSNPSVSVLFIPQLNRICDERGYDFEKMVRLLLWPITALRQSFHLLNWSASKGIMKYGVNSVIIENMTEPARKNSAFEFQVFPEAIHIAHALDATYFPFFTDDKKFSDYPYASVMGHMLNFYRYCNIGGLSDNVFYHRNCIPHFQLLEIFEVDEFCPVLEFEKEVSSPVIRKGLRSFFSELSSMDDESRACCIVAYNNKVRELVEDKKGYSCLLSLASDILGYPMAILGQVCGWIMGNMPDLRESLDKIRYEILLKDKPRQHISLLSRINRVARLKKTYN